MSGIEWDTAAFVAAGVATLQAFDLGVGKEVTRLANVAEELAKGHAAVRTGNMRRGIGHTGAKKIGNEWEATVYSTTHYSKYVEFGTRYMNAQPFMRPAMHQLTVLLRSPA
jgi:HK97 gp10 family phage protein